MTKAELISAAAQDAGLTRKKTEEVFNALFSAIERSLTNGEKVQLVGFGSFEVKERAGRMGRNLTTGEPVEIPPSKGVQFKAGKPLKDKLNPPKQTEQE